MIEDALIEAMALVSREGGCPQDMFVPGYGQVLKNGEPTDAGLEWYKNEILPGLKPE